MEFVEFMQNLLHPLKWVLWASATHLFHYRQNFYHWSLWVPIGLLWSLVVTLFIAEFWPTPFMVHLVIIHSALTGLFHLWGAYLHLIGVGRRVGGQNVHNHMVGPPVILPLIVATVATIDVLRLLEG